MSHVFVARQPIFDRADQLFAYELLYRQSAAHSAAGGATPARMSAEVMVHALLEIGLDRLTGESRAFINADREMLLCGALELLDPARAVIEVLEHVAPDDEVLAACRRLKRQGFQLALDDFVYEPALEPLLALADLLKLDVLDVDAHELQQRVAPLRARRLPLLAERVETAAVRERCRALGFRYFQGYFFARPETLSGSALSTEQLALIRLVNLLHDERTPDQVLETEFAGDPALSYKLLRMVNAAALGGRGIESIPHAIRLLGRAALRRWVALLLASSVGVSQGVERERVQRAVERGRFCELLGEMADGAALSGPLFLVGLFSQLDALLRTPMEELVRRIDLASAVRSALLRQGGPYAGWLALVEAYERGEWHAVAEYARSRGVAVPALSGLYLSALQWARERVQQMHE